MASFYKDQQKEEKIASDPFGRTLPVTYNLRVAPRMMEDKQFKEFYDRYSIRDHKNQ